MNRQSKMIIIIGVVIWVLTLAVIKIYSSYILDKSVERDEELEKQREQIESYIREHSEYLEPTDEILFSRDKDGNDVRITHIFDKSGYIFGDYCESVLNAFKGCIDNDLIEWDYNKDTLSISIRTSNDTLFFEWKTNDLEKGLFNDHAYIRQITPKTIKEVKEYDLNEEIEKKYGKYSNN